MQSNFDLEDEETLAALLHYNSLVSSIGTTPIQTTYQYVIISANPGQPAISGIPTNPLRRTPEVLLNHAIVAPVHPTPRMVPAVPRATSVSGGEMQEMQEERGSEGMDFEMKEEEEIDLEEERHYVDEVKKLSAELRNAFRDLESRLQRLEGQTGRAPPGKTLLENHLGTGYAVLRRIIRRIIKHFMPSGPINTQPPTNPDHSPPVLQQGNFTFSWDQDIKCRFNLVAVDKLTTFLFSNHTFAGAVLSAASNHTPVDRHELRKLVKMAFWIHIQYLYTKRRRSLAPPQVQAARLHNDAVSKRKLTLIKARKGACSGNTEMGGKITALLTALTDAGFSSDEPAEMPSEGASLSRRRQKPRTYCIRELTWRSKELTGVLRALDDYYRLQRQGGQGSPPRERKPHVNCTSSRSPPLGLPRNFYDEAWLKGYERSSPFAYRELVASMKEEYNGLKEIAARLSAQE